jgi:hypothetical protein
MCPLTSADLLPASAPTLDQVPQEAGQVIFYGTSDDLIEVEGKVPGCNEYAADDAHFMVIGETAQVRVRVWYTSDGLWAISASQAAEGMDILPVRIEGGSGQPSVRAVVDAARLITREF